MMTTREVSNSDDLIDSRDVIARIEELEGERQALADALDEIEGDGYETAAARDKATADLAEWDADNGDELKALKSLAEQCEGYTDWEHGATLIRDSYFEDYAEGLAEDIHGSAIRNAEWPMSYIDWTAAAEALQQDYTSVDFDGVDYWVR